MTVRLNDQIFKRDTHRGPPIRFPRYNEEVLETAMNNQSWRLLEDVTKDYEMLNSNLLRCAEAATENQVARTERLNAKAKDLLRRRGELRRDPTVTHLEKSIVNKACRLAVKESLKEYRKQKLMTAAMQRKSLKCCRKDLVDYRTETTCLKDNQGRPTTSRQGIESIVMDFYTKLYRSTTVVPRSPCPANDEIPPILISEVRNVIESLKFQKAPGPDGISAELLKAGGITMQKVLAEHFNHYLRKGEIPEQWKCSKTVLIFKKGDKEDIGNYRPIALLSIVYKVFTKIILNRLEDTLDSYQPPEQAGFRKGFCCLDISHNES
ncbi:hypothetical protein COOONC_01585 [Cooperia oncophora]